MATIGRVATVITANTVGLQKGVGVAIGSLGGLGSSAMLLATKFGPLGAAIGAVSGIAGIGQLVNSSFRSIDALAKMSDGLGLTTEALAGLRRAADRSGVAADAFEKGIARMQKNLSTAAAGGGAAAKNMRTLGLSIDDVRSMSPDDQFLTIADAISKVEDRTDKTRLAMEMFGRDGIGVLKIVGKGAESARAELAKAAELGMAPSREDAALVEDANDAIADMKDSFVGVANVIAVTVAPWMKAVAERVTAVGIVARKAFEGIRPAAAQFGNLVSTVFSKVSAVAQSVFGGVLSSGVSLFGQITDFVTDWMIMSEFAWNNVGAVAEMAWERVKLGAVSFWNDLSHIFTAQIPGVLSWFAENWGDIFFTATDYALTVFINLGQNIRNIWSGVLDFFAGNGFNVDWTPLSEGFVNTISKLPDIPERALSDLEVELGRNVDAMTGRLTDGMAEHMTRRRNELFGDIPPIEVDVEPDLDASGLEAGERIDKAAGAAQRGSAEATSAILAATRQGGRDVLEDQAKQQTGLLTQAVQELRSVARNTKGPQIQAATI